MGDLVAFPRERSLGASLSSVEVALAWRVSVRTVDRWRVRGCPFEQACRGGAVRFREVEVREWLRGQGRSV